MHIYTGCNIPILKIFVKGELLGGIIFLYVKYNLGVEHYMKIMCLDENRDS